MRTWTLFERANTRIPGTIALYGTMVSLSSCGANIFLVSILISSFSPSSSASLRSMVGPDEDFSVFSGSSGQ